MTEPVTFQFTKESILRDYRIAHQSRQASLIGRKEVLTGKGKFGIFGDGKEVAQVAMARAFRKGDIRSGYYRDQTLMMSLGVLRIEEFFAQLYADPDIEREPASAGRQMNGHFATRMLDESGRWRDLTQTYNSSADLSPTGSQMPRLVGLAYASKLFRELPELASFHQFSSGGDEIAFGTIGNASCAEGMFWEAVNACGVLKVPMLLSIWDDGYGISVPNKFQVTKRDLSSILSGFQREPGSEEGYDIYSVRGWDYPALCETYLSAAEIVRAEHVPAIVHVTEVTQPQGHSTSGSHERYKSEERLEWEVEFDGLRKMREWMITEAIASDEELKSLEREDEELVREMQKRAWDQFLEPILSDRDTVMKIVEQAMPGVQGDVAERLTATIQKISRRPAPARRDLMGIAHDVLVATRGSDEPARQELATWHKKALESGRRTYGSDLYCETERSALEVEAVPARYAEDAPTLNGFEILNHAFDSAFDRMPNLVAFGQDVGQLGDVNQGLAGLQAKYGSLRVSDAGIRETTILGQAIGMAMRGLRPVAEIQYLDYVLYALQIMSDDLSTLRWRTAGGQMAPVIVRTRGHRLEGVWHSGSPMGAIVNLCRGMHVCVPRDMTRAAGMYNTLLQSDDPAIVVEVLNGYRSKERLPENVGEFSVPLGQPEVIREGADVTVVTYGACCKIASEAAELAASVGIDMEIVDVQTLLPFDLNGRIAASIEKTNRVLFLDEDVPGGASAYMMQQVIEEAGGFAFLDADPKTLSAAAHRPPYGSDGDYFSKPNREDVFNAVYELMRQTDPGRFPEL